jgi:hypothetical protein
VCKKKSKSNLPYWLVVNLRVIRCLVSIGWLVCTTIILTEFWQMRWVLVKQSRQFLCSLIWLNTKIMKVLFWL